ncbi:MFS transporter [Stigmatella erecta]|uniref:MFS transporter, MHS family, alpha-ketoglutarate permease n=1 Tax=Stigmatella erecta TaxID=83460 RepID=A0A1H9ZYV8_9BACT|nr:MFS transporter [Stigmatella erecta]SES86990.1 MFS transporter, MHS family, alpha-ketoglutarate permease [Stigmatella erecta]
MRGMTALAMPGVRQRLRSIFGGSVGNLIEWYDFYIYSAFSLYFAKAFFPSGNPIVEQLNTAGVFALGFLVRPVGGWVMGLYADLRGRRAALTLSVTLMCLGSLVIALCPTYEQVGVAAPMVLVLARLLQGLSLGGEYGTSATYLSEVATSRHRGFYSSFQYVTLIMGQLLATLTLLLLQRLVLTHGQLEAWGWRIPFVCGAALAVFGFYMRRNMVETEAFQAEAAKHPVRHPMRELLSHPREIALVVGLTLGGTLAFYTYTVYMQKFLVNSVGLTRDQATLISVASLFFYMLLQPVFGLLSDKVGRKPVLLWFGVMGTLCTVPLLTALTRTRDAFTAFLLVMAALVIVSGYTSINAVVKAELFPANIRALGVGLPYALTVSLFGGTAEYLGTWLKLAGHEAWFFWYVTTCILCSLFVYLFMRDTQREHRFG